VFLNSQGQSLLLPGRVPEHSPVNSLFQSLN
jgi:hypothetical protein